MKKFFLSLAVFVMVLCANAQTNQYFWYQGNLMMGNPIAQIDSVTFENEDTDSILIYLPRTIIKTVEVHDTTYVAVHDTLYIHDCDTTPKYMGHEYIDLGLPSGLLWATCNVGAESPEQVGDYYAWGETQTKTSYTSSTYLYTTNQISLSDISGTEYDAARANWGGEWKMPSESECAELISYCTLKDTTINGVEGKLAIGTNSNRAFFPGGGHAEENGRIDEFGGPGFWTSTACGSTTAYRVWEWSYTSYSHRRQGFPVRPVVNKDVVGEINSGSSTPTIVHDTVYITIHDTVCPNENPDTTHNGFRYVDLGLSVMWADANVGAENPEDYGSYFAWGEIEQKDYYGFYNYKYGYYKTMSKYCMDSDHGTIDGLATLLPEDDAATVNMGGTWRMPSAEEWEELINNCIITEDTINTHPGYRFTASNMKSIFIPQSGWIWGDREASLSDPNGSLGRGILYWTADLDPNYSAGARVVGINEENNPISGEVSTKDRHIGCSVRGVFSK